MQRLITLTTDFGVSSPYVAQMKGVLLSRVSDAMIVDVTHAIAPQQVDQAAMVLDDVAHWFPPGTLHVSVVDPGVGTERRILYMEAGDQRYLAPDNGLLTLVARRREPRRIIRVANAEYFAPSVSSTFHGRDIFAPVAAHLLLGVSPESLGPTISDFIRLEFPVAEIRGDQILGHVLTKDAFGNLITNIPRPMVAEFGDFATLRVTCLSSSIEGIGRTYGERTRGELVAIFDSQDRLEIAVVGGNAAEVLQAKPGTCVVVQRITP